MRGDLIIFDFDGTLADSWRDIATALNRTLAEVGLPSAEETAVRAWIGDGVIALLRRATGTSDERHLEELYRRYGAHYARCCLDSTALYPGMREALDELAANTFAVVSNKPARFLAAMLSGLGVAERFAVAVGGDTVPAPKPDPAAIRYVVAALAAGSTPVWMVGDSAVDVATGRAYGARTIGCAWGLRSADELRRAGAEFVVAHPRELGATITGAGSQL